MADSLLCLELGEETLAAVSLRRTGRVSTVTGCVTVDCRDRPLAEAAAELRRLAAPLPQEVRLCLGSTPFFFANLALPFSRRRQVAQVLPFELAEQLPLPIEALQVDFLTTARSTGGSEVLALLLPREFLDERLAALQAGGIEVDSVSLSGLALAGWVAADPRPFLLVDGAGDRVTLFLGRGGRISLIRGLPLPAGEGGSGQADFASAFRQTILSWTGSSGVDLSSLRHLLGAGCPESLQMVLINALAGLPPANRLPGLPLVKMSREARAGYRPELMERAVAHGLAALEGRGPQLEFLPGQSRLRRLTPRRRRLLKLAAVSLAVALLLLVASLGRDYATALSHQEALQQEIASLFRQTLPGTTRIVDPVRQLQVVNNELRRTYRPGGEGGGRATVLQLLSELSARIPATLPMRISRLQVDSGAVQLRGVTGDFNTVDSVQKELAKSPLFQGVTINSASQSLQDDLVRFELKLTLARR